MSLLSFYHGHQGVMVIIPKRQRQLHTLPHFRFSPICTHQQFCQQYCAVTQGDKVLFITGVNLVEWLRPNKHCTCGYCFSALIQAADKAADCRLSSPVQLHFGYVHQTECGQNCRLPTRPSADKPDWPLSLARRLRALSNLLDA